MLKNATYREKFALLKVWMPAIADAIKKELRSELSQGGPSFSKKYFPTKNTAKLTAEELAQGYLKAIESEENGEAIAEFVANSWLLKNTDLYHFFESELKQIAPNLEELESIENLKAKQISEAAIAEFGAKKSYLFSVMNSVVFPEEVYQSLEEKANQDVQQQQEQRVLKEEASTLNKVKADAEAQLARLKDKYEKKLAGLERKYLQDVTSLKKQISNLQRQLIIK